MGVSLAYIQGADLPDLTVDWTEDRVLLDLTGHTFVLKLGIAGDVAALTKATGITGSATSPNLRVQWSITGELNTLPPGVYTLHLVATRTSDNKQRILQGALTVKPAIA